MLWNLTSALLPPQDAQEQLTEGLRLHLRYGPLISLLVRQGTAERSYLLVRMAALTVRVDGVRKAVRPHCCDGSSCAADHGIGHSRTS